MAFKLCSGFGYTKAKGFFLTLDGYNHKLQALQREHAFVNKSIISIKGVKLKYCTGFYDLKSMESFPCPYIKNVNDKFKNCVSCFTKTGFNPAFFNVSLISLSKKQQEYNQLPHYVYLALFDESSIKVGIAYNKRLFQRLTEQGARYATVIKLCDNAYDAHKLEVYVKNNFNISDKMHMAKKKRILLAGNNICYKNLLKLKKSILASIKEIDKHPKIYHLDKFYSLPNISADDIHEIMLAPKENLLGTVMAAIGSFLFIQNDKTRMLDMNRLIGKAFIKYT